MGYEDQDHAHIDELFNMVSLIGSGVGGRGQVSLKELMLTQVESFKLVCSNTCKKYVLNSEEAQEETLKGAFADCVNQFCSSLISLLLFLRRIL